MFKTNNLVSEGEIKISNVLDTKTAIFLLKKCEKSFYSAKDSRNFLTKNISAFGFVSTVRLHESLTNNFISILRLANDALIARHRCQ